MYSTHISFIKASPIATYDIIRGKNYNLTMYLKEKKLEIFVSSISDSPKHLYQYMIYCFIQDLFFLVSCFSTIFTLVYLNFTEILTVKVYFAIFYLDLMTYQRFMFFCLFVYQQVTSLLLCKLFTGKSPFYGLKYTFFFSVKMQLLPMQMALMLLSRIT